MNTFAYLLDDRSGGQPAVLRVVADDAAMARALALYWLTVDGTRDRAMVDLCLHPAVDLGDLALSEGDVAFLRMVFRAGPCRIVSLPSDLRPPPSVVVLPNGLGDARVVGGTREWR